MGQLTLYPGRLCRAGILGLSFLLIIICSLPALAADICTTIIADGGFEGGSAAAAWVQTSTNFSTPLCTVNCGTGGPGIGPRSGVWWAWFGGITLLEEASLEQSITMPASGIARLKFYLWNKVSGNAGDFLKVKLDDTYIFTSLASDPLYTAGYTPVILDLAAYADGLAHTLRFESITTGPQTSNIFVDDVSMATNNWFMNATADPLDLNDLLQPVLNNAVDGQEIRAQEYASAEDIVFNPSGEISLTLRGGFTCDFGSNATGAMTAISSLEIRGGTLVLENFALI